MYMSKIQKDALESIEIVKKLGENRPFTQCEIPGVTKNTTNALVDKGFLKLINGPFGERGPEYFIRTDKVWYDERGNLK